MRNVTHVLLAYAEESLVGAEFTPPGRRVLPQSILRHPVAAIASQIAGFRFHESPCNHDVSDFGISRLLVNVIQNSVN
jgi:hypothetical protein